MKKGQREILRSTVKIRTATLATRSSEKLVKKEPCDSNHNVVVRGT